MVDSLQSLGLGPLAVLLAVLVVVVFLVYRLRHAHRRLQQLQLDTHSLALRLENHQHLEQRLQSDLDIRLDEIRHAQTTLEQLRQQQHATDTQLQLAQAQLSQKDRLLNEQAQQFNENKHALRQEFENLANKIFAEKGRDFSQHNQSHLEAILKPFREQIAGFQQRINEVHDASVQGQSYLYAEIKKVMDIGLQMNHEAQNLSAALKGSSQQRGAWGEAQLRRTLEMSGLIADAHYEAQTAFKDEAGRHKQTDFIVKLPDHKHIIIDSKVTLNAYDRLVGATTAAEQQAALNAHIQAVRKHMDDLASKDYTQVIGMRSPSFVLMFMPIEPAYIEALKHSSDLFEYGYQQGIVLVSHTTLIPILRTVANLWMIEHSNAEAREISERAGDIYNQVCVVAERLQRLGSTLNSASNHYNQTITALVGQQGLYSKVDRFSQLSTKVNKQLPPLESSTMNFEHSRLADVTSKSS